MKQKLVIIGALVLLLALIAFMFVDFYCGKQENKNPYELNMDSLRIGDTAQVMYRETAHFTPSFVGIHGIAVDKNDRIYIGGEDTLEVADLSGKVLHNYTIGGTARCVNIDEKGNILLGMEDHVEILDPDGKLLSRWAPQSPKSYLTSIGVSGADIFVADAGNTIVYRYDYQGKLLGKIGQKDPAQGIPGFIIPSPYFDLATTSDGFIWVVNPGRHQLEKYNREGRLITKWGKASMGMTGFCGCCNPSNIALFPDGSFVTSEKAIERVKLYDPQGNFVGIAALPVSFKEGTKGLDLAVTTKGAILVLDPVKNQVRKFEKK